MRSRREGDVEDGSLDLVDVDQRLVAEAGAAEAGDATRPGALTRAASARSIGTVSVRDGSRSRRRTTWVMAPAPAGRPARHPPRRRRPGARRCRGSARSGPGASGTWLRVAQASPPRPAWVRRWSSPTSAARSPCREDDRPAARLVVEEARRLRPRPGEGAEARHPHGAVTSGAAPARTTAARPRAVQRRASALREPPQTSRGMGGTERQRQPDESGPPCARCAAARAVRRAGPAPDRRRGSRPARRSQQSGTAARPGPRRAAGRAGHLAVGQTGQAERGHEPGREHQDRLGGQLVRARPPGLVTES